MTSGPYTVKLLAADVAAAFRLIHGPDARAHVNGISLGFGVALSLAFNQPSLTLSVSGGGFRADSQTEDWVPWLFSRAALIRLLGMQLIGLAAEAAVICRCVMDTMLANRLSLSLYPLSSQFLSVICPPFVFGSLASFLRLTTAHDHPLSLCSLCSLYIII